MGQRQISRRPNPDTKCGVYICGRLNRKGGTIPEITLSRSTRYRPYPFRYPIPNLVSAPFWFHCASRVSGCPSSCSAGRLLHSTRRTISRVTRVQIPSRTPPFQRKIDGLSLRAFGASNLCRTIAPSVLDHRARSHGVPTYRKRSQKSGSPDSRFLRAGQLWEVFPAKRGQTSQPRMTQTTLRTKKTRRCPARA